MVVVTESVATVVTKVDLQRMAQFVEKSVLQEGTVASQVGRKAKPWHRSWT